MTLDPRYAGESIYREHVLDHYKNPRNKGTLKNADVIQKELNPVCGDQITISLIFENSKVKDIRFEGQGCVISQASASMLSETLVGKRKEDIKNLTREDMLELLGIPLGPARIKCALLGLVALKNSIREEKP